MKVGILTFHYGSNYGGILQCYALQQVIKGLGHEVQVINYFPHQNHKKFARVVLTAFKRFSYPSLRALWYNIRYQRQSRRVFREFRNKYLNLTIESNHIENFRDYDFDTIIVGSDQVWVYPQVNNVYFLGWVNNPHIKKIAYAVCSGYGRVNESYRVQMAEQLSQFKAVSVRSQTTKDFVRKVTGVDAPILADPTVLYDFNEFLIPNREKYILTYILTDDIDGGNGNAVNNIRKKYPGMPVYSIIISDRYPRLAPWADRQLMDVSPSDWVNLVYNCSFLYTDSYHGALFAMKFGKPFLAYYSSENCGCRLNDMKVTYHLNNIVSNLLDIDNYLVSDVSPQVNMDELKSISMKFLRENLISE